MGPHSVTRTIRGVSYALATASARPLHTTTRVLESRRRGKKRKKEIKKERKKKKEKRKKKKEIRKKKIHFLAEINGTKIRVVTNPMLCVRMFFGYYSLGSSFPLPPSPSPFPQSIG